MLPASSSVNPRSSAAPLPCESAGTVAGSSDWQTELNTAIRDPHHLCHVLRLPTSWANAAVRASRHVPLLVPWSYLSRIRVGDPGDPLLRQILPIDEELREVRGFTADPVGDTSSKRTAGLLQKYSGRALMITAGACAVHCRFCFRRHFAYQEALPADASGEFALAEIAADTSLEEIVLSGGDPFVLPDDRLAKLLVQLSQVPHIKRVRIHTRLPIMIPQRVTGELLDGLSGLRLDPVVVVHCNHPSELDGHVRTALVSLVARGILVFNQSVLLRGVNDDFATLAALSRRLLECRVVPYYLHQLDRVAGAAHFEVPVERGRQLICQLRDALPGYAVPRYVRENAGEASKTPLA